MAISSTLTVQYVGPDDPEIGALIESAFESESLRAVQGRGFTFLESAQPPVHIVISLSVAQIEGISFGLLAAAYLKGIAEEFGKDTYAGAKAVLVAIARSIRKSYGNIKGKRSRESFYSVGVTRNDGSSITYNVPGVDEERALADLVDDVLHGNRDPKRGDLFWNCGRWLDYDQYETLRDGDPAENPADAGPTLDFLNAAGKWTSIVGRPAAFSVMGNGRDVAIEVPPGINSDTLSRAILALREAMPESQIGLTPNRKEVSVSDAASSADEPGI